MATGIEFAPNQHATENITAHVLWMTIGLSCEGDSVAMTSSVGTTFGWCTRAATRASSWNIAAKLGSPQTKGSEADIR